MTWSTLWPQNRKPSPDDIAEFVDNPLWKALCSWLESGYRTVPRIEYSRCGMAPGWNVKYTKGGRALCTLYPAAGSFTCLVSGSDTHLDVYKRQPDSRLTTGIFCRILVKHPNY